MRPSFSPAWTGPGSWSGKRFSTTTPGQVTGYAVALPGDTAKDGGPVWYGGGKLAADLTWPKLRQRWTRPGAAPSGGPLTAADQKAIWEHAAQVAADATARIRALAGTNPAAAADAAWAASDTLHVAAAALGSPALRQAADAYDRAARAPYGRIPAPSPAGNQLRHAARLIGALAYLTRDPALMPLVLITRLAALAEAVAELRRAQQHAAQAAAARTAAQRLHAAARAAPAAPRPADPVPAAPPGSPMNPSPSPSGPSPANPHPASRAPGTAPGQDAGPRRHGHAAPAADLLVCRHGRLSWCAGMVDRVG